MAIKRGVSLYSYQQAQFFKQLDWKGQIREVREGLHTDGIEIIDEALIPHYPFPSEEFIFDWNSYMARYDMKAVTMDVYLDVHQFRDHVMTHREAAEHLKNDIILASKMGFKNVRALILCPADVIEMALPTAEKYGVRIGKEIHAPWPIKLGTAARSKKGMAAAVDSRAVEEIIDLAQRTGSKNVGLVPDFGIFQDRPSEVAIAYIRRHAKIQEAVDFVLENSTNYSHDEMLTIIEEKYPGHYQDRCIDYTKPMKVLLESGYDGYIDSEYEGQRDQQDRGIEDLPDEVEQVRRHHEMLKRLGCK